MPVCVRHPLLQWTKLARSVGERERRERKKERERDREERRGEEKERKIESVCERKRERHRQREGERWIGFVIPLVDPLSNEGNSWNRT